MATFELTGQDGGTYRIDAPDQNAALSAFNKMRGVQPPSAQPLAGGFATRAQRGEDVAPPVSGAEAFVRGAYQGSSFGFADEINALRRANPNAAPMPPPSSDAPMSDNERMFRRQRQGGDQGTLSAIGNLANMATGDQATKDAYDTALRDERSRFKQAETERPIASFAGNIVGGAAVPMGPVNTVRQGVATGAGLGALYGFGSGEGLEGSLGSAAVGAGAGGIIGAGLGKLAANQAARAAAPTNEVADAASRAGIDIPVAIASDNRTVQRMGQGIRNVPLAGEKMVNAAAKTGEQTTQALDNMALGLGSSDAATAGQAASTSIKNWITGDSKTAVNAAYKAVDDLVNPSTRSGMPETSKLIADIAAKNSAAGLSAGPAVGFVEKQAANTDGLTYDAMKLLRTKLREEIKSPGSILPSGVDRTELKRVYTAVTQDLTSAVENAGGPQARMAWEKANRFNQMVSQRREELAKVIGENADAAAEKVFGRLQTMASTSSAANIQMLAKARSAIGSEWGEVSSAVIGNLGRDAQGNFTPDRFVTAYGKLSDAGKNILFDKSTRVALDDIATISARMSDVGRKFGNPSGTAQNVGFAAIATGVYAAPTTTMATILGGNILARILSKPATAASAAKWSRAYEMAVTKPTAGSLSLFNIASRNFANTISDKLGVNVTADHLLKALSGPVKSHGETDQEKQR
jgi:hypothetical protein